MDENGSPVCGRSIDRKSNQLCLWFRTICHDGDSHKLCYFTETKDFYCYTCCGKMTFFNFIKKIKNLKEEEFYQAVSYVAQKVGINASRDRIGVGEKVIARECREKFEAVARRREQMLYNPPIVEINKFYDDSILKYFDENTFYKGWIDEGISIDTMRKFGIRWYEYQKHIIIPHYNINGQLVGIRRRSLKPEDKNNKYMPEFLEGKSYEHSLGLNLYGLYENQEAIKRKKRAIIVEGEKSVLLSDSFFGNESVAVATCGFNVSNWQLQSLFKLGVNEILLGFDKDFDILKEEEYKKDEKTWKDYNRYLDRLDSLCQRISKGGQAHVYLIRDRNGLLNIKDSPFDQGKKTLEKLIKDKKKIIHNNGDV